jgi:hypothetical protein
MLGRLDLSLVNCFRRSGFALSGSFNWSAPPRSVLGSPAPVLGVAGGTDVSASLAGPFPGREAPPSVLGSPAAVLGVAGGSRHLSFARRPSSWAVREAAIVSA